MYVVIYLYTVAIASLRAHKTDYTFQELIIKKKTVMNTDTVLYRKVVS